MKRVLLHLFLLACIVDVSAQQSTNDKFVLSSIKNSQGEIVDTLIADGMARQFVISLNGSNRKYTAFNVDITFPKGLSVGQTAAGYTVTKPEGADIYSGTQHAVYSNLLSVTKLRIACFSSELENLSTESGEILEIQFIPSKSMKTGKYTLQFSEQNLTAISGNEVQKYVPEASEYEFYVITLSDAFAAYKTQKKEYVATLGKEDDSQAVKSLITKAQTSIQNLSLSNDLSLAENKARVDAIVEQLVSDIAAQRAADQLAAAKANFESYKTTNITAADNMLSTGDGNEVIQLVADAKSSITSLTYDEGKTLEENKARVDAIIEKLTTDIAAQRAADKADFETYKTSNSAAASALIKDGDSDAVKKLISDAKTAIIALAYDESKTLADNKARVDAIMNKLTADVEAQRKADQLAADKADFEQYKSELSTSAGKMISSGDGNAVQQLIANAQSAITALTYDESKTLADNKARVDAIIEKLTTDIAAQRAADKADFEAYKTSNGAAAKNMSLEGDGEAVRKLINDAQTAIAALTYDESKTLADNKARVDAIIEKVTSDVASQRAAEKADFDAYKSSNSATAKNMSVEGDSEAVRKLINDAQAAITALTYDESKTLADNKARVDAIMERLASDVEAQRKADQLAADKAAFEHYKSDLSTTAGKMISSGDGSAVQQLIANAQSAIAALRYDESKSLADNKARVDAIIEKLTTDIAAQRAADKANFEAYKTSNSAAAQELLLDGDGDDIKKLVSDAQASIAALTYDESKTLADNKARIDAIMEKLVVDVAAQRSDDQLAADKAAFGLYKTSRSNAAHDMLLEGDSEAVQKLVSDAQTAIAALTYDESKTLADNKARVDAIMDKLTSDVEAQRKAEQLEKEKSDFDDSKSDYSDIAEDLIQEGDGDDVQQLINEALAAIAALPFDESLTLEENKARIDAILAKLTADIEKQRKLAADKVDFEQYKTSRSATTNELMAEGDGNDVQRLIANAQAALAALTYDENKTLAENKAIVDSIIDQLVVSIQEQRSIDSIAQVNGEISSGDVNVYTLSGKKASRITKPGIYIINGKKMKLK